MKTYTKVMKWKHILNKPKTNENIYQTSPKHHSLSFVSQNLLPLQSPSTYFEDFTQDPCSGKGPFPNGSFSTDQKNKNKKDLFHCLM